MLVKLQMSVYLKFGFNAGDLRNEIDNIRFHLIAFF